MALEFDVRNINSLYKTVTEGRYRLDDITLD